MILLGCIFFLCGFLLNNTFVFLVALVADHVSAMICAVIISLLEYIEFISSSFCLFLGGLLHNLFGGFGILYSIVFILCGITGILLVIYSISSKNKAPKLYI